MPLTSRFRRSKESKIEGRLVVDDADFKVASVTYEGKLLLFGIGMTEERQVEGEAAIDITGGKGKYQSQKGMKWKVLFDRTQFPNMMPLEDVKLMAASTVALSSDASAFNNVLKGEFKEEKPENLNALENRLQMWRQRKSTIRRSKIAKEKLVNELTTFKNENETKS